MKKHSFFLKTLAILISTTLLITALPKEILASKPILATTNQKQTTSLPEERTEAPQIVGEQVEERTQNTKTFRMSDGTYTMAIYDQPIHYEQDGKMEEIDNTLVKKENKITKAVGEEIYQNKEGNTTITIRHKKDQSQEKGYETLQALPEALRTCQSIYSEVYTKSREENQPYEIGMQVGEETITWSYEGMKEGILCLEDAIEGELTEGESDLCIPSAIRKGTIKEAFAYTDMEYLVMPEGIKENILLKDKKAPNQWTLILNIGKLTAIQTDEQTIQLYEKESNEPVMEIGAPVMTDANGKVSMDVTLFMEVRGETLRVTITANQEFLQEKDTAYPVTVDPYYFLVAKNNVNISDTFLSSAMPGKNMRSNGVASGSLIVGKEASTYGKTRALLKMDTLPELPAGSVIHQASLILKNYYSYSANTGMTIEVRKATGDWTQSTATWNNSSHLYENLIKDYAIVPQNTNPTNAFDTWEITSLVKGWYEGTIPNHGVMLTAFDVENLSTAKCTKYYSSNSYTYGGIYPTFLIAFRCNVGVEDYWSFHSQSLNGGEGAVQDASGNLVFHIPVAQTTGGNLPVNVSFVYNSAISNRQYCNNTKGAITGAGFMLNYGQRLDRVENVSTYSSIADELKEQGFDYVWLDEDGTEHFFQKQSDGTYKDEDGLGLTMKMGQSDGGFTNLNIIEDKEGNQRIFLSNGYLLSIKNHFGQKISLSYDGAKLSKITDGAGRSLSFGYVSTTLTSITGPEGTVTFQYSGATLYTIHFPDGTQMNFSHLKVLVDGSAYYLLNSITGRDGGRLIYTYNTTGTSGHKCRVSRVTEYAADGSAGNQILFDYSKQNATTVSYIKSSGTVTETYQFDNWGHTSGVVGEDGSTANIRYYSAIGTTAVATNHKIAGASAGSRYVDNLLSNHSAEYGTTGWSTSMWSTSSADYAIDTTQSYLGNQSLKVEQSYSQPTRCGWKQSLKLTPGKTYTFSGYAKTKGVVQSPGCGATLYIVAFQGGAEVKRFECDTILIGESDWRRLSITFTVPNEATSVEVYGGLKYANGTAWFDCFQLEENDTVSPYNLLENSSLNSTAYWSRGNLTSSDGITAGTIMLNGSPTVKKYMVQKINIGKPGVAFYMRADASAHASPNKGTSSCIAIDIGITYVDGTTDWFYEPFNADIDGWQTTSFTVAPKENNRTKTIQFIQAFVLYYNQVNTAYFDNLMVTMDETGTTYAYDNEGNIITSKDNAGRQTTYTINNASDMITTLTDSTNTVYSYTYDTTDPKKLTSAKENSTGIGFEYTYGTGNNKGNVETVRMGMVGAMTKGKYMESRTQYTSNGAYITSQYDQRGGKTEYQVNETTGEIYGCTDPKGNETTYTYDATTKNLTGVQSGEANVTYGYEGPALGNCLKSIKTGTTEYNFAYDKWFQISSITVGSNRTLITNTYGKANGNLEKTTYGNGQSITYGYDKYDRLITKSVSDTTDATAEQRAIYHYNSNGQLARIKDVKNGETTTYAYDLSERLTEYLNGQGRITYGYDQQDRTSKMVTEFQGLVQATIYQYRSANRPGVTILPVGRIDRSYDSLQRETVHQVYAQKDATIHLRNETTFEDLGGNQTTQCISRYETYVGSSATDKTRVEGYTDFAYTYDANGNIESITEKNGDDSRIKTYTYDGQNQLVREDDEAQGKTITYEYDKSGNRLRKTEYAYTTEEVGEAITTTTYGYEEEWKDLLSAYNGQTITYDGIGNPITYRDGMRFSWREGRQLESTTLTNGTGITYQYNTDGIRTGKIVGNTKTTYFVDSSGTIQAQKQGKESLIFFYDSTGRREGFLHYIGSEQEGAYYYLYNAQSDVIGIVDSSFTPVVWYEYDSWGKVLSVRGEKADTIGALNPFYYRGYVYDAETGLYYVSSRYYDPEIGRFINADDIEYLGADGSPLSYNLFAYCMNNPVNRFDVNGNWSLPNRAKIAIGAVAIAGLVVATVCTGGAAGVIAGAALTGAISGGVSGTISGAISGAIEDGWQGALDGACTGFVSGTLIGGATGALTSGLSMATGAVKVVGSAQKTGTALHRAASNIEAGKMALNLIKYSKITLNRSLNTAGLSGRRIPDVIGVARNGSSVLIEVVSKSQTIGQMTAKCISMVQANPGATYKVVGWAATISRLLR